MKKIKTNLNLYKTFLEVCEMRNLSAAAQNLNLTQPTLSYNIKELEKQLHIRLFNSNSRGVEPTKYAEELYPIVKAAFVNLIAAEDAITEFNEQSQGLVRLNTSLYYMPQVVGKLVAEFNKSHPNIKFEITTALIAEGNESIERHESDVAIFAYTDVEQYDTQKYAIVKLIDIENSFFASKEFMKKHGITATIKAEQLAKLPILLPRKGSQIRNSLAKMDVINSVVEANSTDMLIALAKADVGMVFGPEQIAGNGLEKIVVSDIKLPKCKVVLKYNIELANKAAAAFIDMVKKEYK